jgi:hypothetical protein
MKTPTRVGPFVRTNARASAVFLALGCAPAVLLDACGSSVSGDRASPGSNSASMDAGNANASNASTEGGPSPEDGPKASGAEAGATPHVVTACNALGPVGAWQDVTPPQIPIVTYNPPGNFSSGSDGMVAVAVDPVDPATVYVGGGHQTCCADGSDGLFKSTDCGATWNKLDTGRNGSLIDTGWPWYGGLLVDPMNPQMMYVESGYGAEGLWKSTNGGTDWDNLFSPDSGVAQVVPYGVFAEDTAMDPSDPTHLVMTFHTNCTGDYAPMCMGESTDGGNTWRLFKGPPVLTGWQEGAGAVVLGTTTFLYAAPFDGLYYTKDSGADWEKVASAAYFQLYTTAAGVMYLGSGTGILTSTDGHAWTAVPGAPNATAVIGDGVNLFASFGNDTGGQPYWTALESDPTKWTNVKTPTISQGASQLAYDADHHVLYSASLNGGLWRVVTR